MIAYTRYEEPPRKPASKLVNAVIWLRTNMMYTLRNRPNPPTNPNLKTSHAAGLHLLGLATGGYIPNPDENRVSRIAARSRAACEYCLWHRTSVRGLRKRSSSVKSYSGS